MYCRIILVTDYMYFLARPTGTDCQNISYNLPSPYLSANLALSPSTDSKPTDLDPSTTSNNDSCTEIQVSQFVYERPIIRAPYIETHTTHVIAFDDDFGIIP